MNVTWSVDEKEAALVVLDRIKDAFRNLCLLSRERCLARVNDLCHFLGIVGGLPDNQSVPNCHLSVGGGQPELGQWSVGGIQHQVLNDNECLIGYSVVEDGIRIRKSCLAERIVNVKTYCTLY